MAPDNVSVVVAPHANGPVALAANVPAAVGATGQFNARPNNTVDSLRTGDAAGRNDASGRVGATGRRRRERERVRVGHAGHNARSCAQSIDAIAARPRKRATSAGNG